MDSYYKWEYYLYTGKGTRTCLDMGDEFDIIATMGEWLKKDENMEFLIVHYDKITTEPSWRTIKGKEEYSAYSKEYYDRIMKNKTCVELKKEMMDIVYGEKPKTKKKNR